nr:reverse transcriptase domain-containing protein [Tanacetum cinerariifolium]
DLLEEKREQAAVQEARSKAKMERYYNARVQNTSFRPGDFVYRNNEASHAKEGANSDLSGRDHTRSRKHWAKERTGLEIAMDTPFREHGISATLKSAICMKCKHPLHVANTPDTLIISKWSSTSWSNRHETSSTKVNMDDPNITMEEYIRLEEEKARRNG